MKKILSVFLVLIAAFVLVACGDNNEGEKIVLITDKGDINDKSFNEGSYKGVQNFGTEHDIDFSYLKPASDTAEEYISAINQAVADGATVIVTPGYLFEGPINVVQKTHPTVKFILLDGSPTNAESGSIESNVYSVFYAEEQSGFLAGYAAVKDGFRKLGFMGGLAVPAVQRFGHGYVQGAAAAAEELELDAGDVTIDYLYTGDFAATPEVQAAAAAMYAGGVEVIFACGGAVGQSVMAAAASANKKVIGVDVDQSFDSDTVITSATKNLAVSVEQALDAIFNTGKWASDFGGKSVVLDASDNGVSLPMENSRFTAFSQAEYDAILAKVVDGTVAVSDVIGAFGDDGNAALQFATDEVIVNVIQFES